MFLLARLPRSFSHRSHWASLKVANLLFSIPDPPNGLALDSASDLPSDPSGPVSASWLQGQASHVALPVPDTELRLAVGLRRITEPLIWAIWCGPSKTPLLMCNQAVRLVLNIASKYNMAGQENSLGWWDGPVIRPSPYM